MTIAVLLWPHANARYFASIRDLSKMEMGILLSGQKGVGAALVFTTGLLAGLLDGIGVLNGAVGLVEKLARRWGRFAASAAVSLGAGMIFCNQSVVIVMGNQLLHRCYTDPNEQAVDMENSGIVLSALIPWNIACSIPLVMLGVDQRAIPYAVLLYMIPLIYGLTKRYVYPHKEKCV